LKFTESNRKRIEKKKKEEERQTYQIETTGANSLETTLNYCKILNV
jgi:hypothetical protein